MHSSISKSAQSCTQMKVSPALQPSRIYLQWRSLIRETLKHHVLPQAKAKMKMGIYHVSHISLAIFLNIGFAPKNHLFNVCETRNIMVVYHTHLNIVWTTTLPLNYQEPARKENTHSNKSWRNTIHHRCGWFLSIVPKEQVTSNLLIYMWVFGLSFDRR